MQKKDNKELDWDEDMEEYASDHWDSFVIEEKIITLNKDKEKEKNELVGNL
jgi:hypothetical protein